MLNEEGIKKLVADYINNLGIDCTVDQVYIVWKCYILGHTKYMVSTNAADGLYFEVTYNAFTDKYYLDHYSKVRNIQVSIKNYGGSTSGSDPN